MPTFYAYGVLGNDPRRRVQPLGSVSAPTPQAARAALRGMLPAHTAIDELLPYRDHELEAALSRSAVEMEGGPAPGRLLAGGPWRRRPRGGVLLRRARRR